MIGRRGRTQPRLAGRVETFEHLRHRQLGQYASDRLVESEPALLDELHRRRRGDRLRGGFHNY